MAPVGGARLSDDAGCMAEAADPLAELIVRVARVSATTLDWNGAVTEESNRLTALENTTRRPRKFN